MGDDNSSSLRQRLKARIKKTSGQLIRGGARTVAAQPLVRAVGRVSERSAAMVLQRMSDQMEAVADMVASRLLSMDELASRMAFFVEQVSADVGRQALLPVILRRNLMLDGTFLRLLEPLLSGKNPSELTLESADRRRALRTLSLLLLDIGALADPSLNSASEDTAVMQLRQSTHEAVLGDVLDVLDGTHSDADTDRFIMFSYLIFLQSHLLRSVAGMTTEIAREQAAGLLTGTTDDGSSDP
jgi:hypothetical protein